MRGAGRGSRAACAADSARFLSIALLLGYCGPDGGGVYLGISETQMAFVFLQEDPTVVVERLV